MLPVTARFYLPPNLSKPLRTPRLFVDILIKLEARVLRYRRIEYVCNF